MFRHLALSATFLLAAASVYAQQGRTVSETEPNNTRATANAAGMGDTLSGAISSRSDVDVFYIDLTIGQQLHIGALAGTGLQVSVSDEDYTPQASFEPALYHDELERNLWFKVHKTGRYFITAVIWDSQNSVTYRWIVDSAPPLQGPGDPTHNFATVGQPAGMVAGNNLLWVATGHRVDRVDASGTVTPFANLPADDGEVPGAIALDGAGNLLVVGQRIIWRVAPNGAVTEFAHTPHNSGAITVGPDGDVWSGDSGAIRRFDAQGTLKQTVAVPSQQCDREHIFARDVSYLAFSPAGELYYSMIGCPGLSKLVNNNTTPQQALPYWLGPQGPTFDRDGYLYLINAFYLVNYENSYNSKVVLFDPSFKQAKDPFSTDIWHDGYLSQLVFWRDAAGNTTDRLFAIGGGHIIELNHAGVRAPGWPVGKQGSQTVTVSGADIAGALMGGLALTAEQVQYLDSHGNHNGVLDVGDLRAYLRALGQLPGSPRP